MDTRLPAHEIDTVRRCFERKHADERFYALAETLLWRKEAVASFDEFDSAYHEHAEQVYAKTIEFASRHLGDFVV